jgi:hypothetical protein
MALLCAAGARCSMAPVSTLPTSSSRIFLHHQIADPEHKGQIADLIFSQRYGRRSFNLDVSERTACMEALYRGEDFAYPEVSESVANILARYDDIQQLFPEELVGAVLANSALPFRAH